MSRVTGDHAGAPCKRCCYGSFSSLSLRTSPPRRRPRGEWTIVPLGDSITEGSTQFSNYRLRLARLLSDAGIPVRFVGSRHTEGGPAFATLRVHFCRRFRISLTCSRATGN